MGEAEFLSEHEGAIHPVILQAFRELHARVKALEAKLDDSATKVGHAAEGAAEGLGEAIGEAEFDQ